jgi:hypothetical protein
VQRTVGIGEVVDSLNQGLWSPWCFHTHSITPRVR